MKPVHEHFGWKTTDLTEGHINRVEQPDGSVRVIAFFPKTWEKDEKPMRIGKASGGTAEVFQYTVTSWYETTLLTE